MGMGGERRSSVDCVLVLHVDLAIVSRLARGIFDFVVTGVFSQLAVLPAFLFPL